MALDLRPLMNRLELLSLRERAMLLIGVPVLLAMLSEFAIFEPARKQAAEAAKQTATQKEEIKALAAALEARPTISGLPAVDQLEKQRVQLQAQVDAARKVLSDMNQRVDWGTLVRTAASRTEGLALTQLKTFPSELAFSLSMVKPPAPAANAPGAASRPPAGRPPTGGAASTAKVVALDGVDSIYKHRCELTVEGDLNAILGYVQSLQQLPGDLHWDGVQVTVSQYPRAKASITLHTLGVRPETPFN